MSELVDSLTRAECSVRELGPAEIAVDVPRAPSADQAERELKIYLALWHAQHPDARAVLLPAD
jgi:Ni,Fe-hydrogenase III component G